MKFTGRYLLIWFLILNIYLLALIGVGQVAFTKQYFNDPESMIGEFLEIKKQYKGAISQPETELLIDNLMENAANSASDLQELASQSFNIILGALLAFLSTSAAVVIPGIQGQPSDNRPENQK